ncbi:alpha-glucan family phosphorylase [Oceanithermus sp.]
MNILGRITELPELPEPLAPLKEMAYNVWLWWSWTPAAQELYRKINPSLWEACRHNPVKLLLEADPERLADLAEDPEYVATVEAVHQSFRAHLKSRPRPDTGTIAYFSAEYGFHESLPIYAGGLGVLAGDHVKAASNLGVDLVGVGIFYHRGYFHQHLSPDGVQTEYHQVLRPEELPLVVVRAKDGKPVKVVVEIEGRKVAVTAYQVQVGTVPVYLMSTDLPENDPADREITAELYNAEPGMRIRQEIVLGIGGVRLLRALGVEPKVWHMNEGHSAFIALERIREYVARGLAFETALEAVAADTIFTTHTPVPAGHDVFSFDQVAHHLQGWWDRLGISRERFLTLAREDRDGHAVFSMSVLALKTSRFAGGVSRLHGEVSRKMFQHLWSGLESEEVPIGHVTNGVHTWTWLASSLRDLYERYFPEGWMGELRRPEHWDVDALPAGELWAARRALREALIRDVRARLREQRLRAGEPPARLRAAERALDPGTLTVVFARRFATYKRADLLFHDPERLKSIVNGPYPIQIVFAGKAHPKDEPGKAMIQKIVRLVRELELEERILVLEDYDIALARTLVFGADLWLNTPRRPMEASGTSGMKSALNGGVNFSVLDGWWAEAYDGQNGWAIGTEREYDSLAAQDAADAASLYDTLEHEILPLFYARDAAGIPTGWLTRVRHSIRTAGARFSAERMVREYLDRYYLPAERHGEKLRAEEFAAARKLARWKAAVAERWPQVRLEVEAPGDLRLNGKALEIEAWVDPAGLAPEHLRLELVLRRSRRGPLFHVPFEPAEGANGRLHYRLTYRPERPGSYAYGVRLSAQHPDFAHPYKVAFVRWA